MWNISDIVNYISNLMLIRPPTLSACRLSNTSPRHALHACIHACLVSSTSCASCSLTHNCKQWASSRFLGELN
jgi:hypothetical protein